MKAWKPLNDGRAYLGISGRTFSSKAVQKQKRRFESQIGLGEASCSLRFQPHSSGCMSYPSSIANHVEPLRANVEKVFGQVQAKIFFHPGKPGKPLHSENRHGQSGYDGYDIRMNCSLKTSYARCKFRKSGFCFSNLKISAHRRSG